MLRKKLKSQSGVSIIMAMFLFLICAVIGSLILTAATATSGRKALAAQNDQRYYSVDSAARLIRDLVTEGSIRVLRSETQVTDVTDHLLKDSIGNSTWVSADREEHDPEYDLTFPGAGPDKEHDLFVFAAENLIPGYDSEDADYGYDSMIAGSGSSKAFSLKTPDQLIPGTDTSFLDVDVVMTVEENGDLVFTFSSDETKAYKLKEVFRLQFSETASSSTVESTHIITEIDETNYTETYSSTSTYYKEGTFQWEFVSSSVE